MSKLRFTNDDFLFALSPEGGGNRQEPIHALLEQVFPKLLQAVKEMGGTPQDAEDCFYSALLELLAKGEANNLKDIKNVPGYLFIAGKHAYLKLSKRENIRKNAESEYLEKARARSRHPLGAPHGKTWKAPEQKVILQLFDRLGKRCKEILNAHFYKGHSMDAIASNFDYTNAASATDAKYRCVQRLKALLKDNPKLNNFIFFNQ